MDNQTFKIALDETIFYTSKSTNSRNYLPENQKRYSLTIPLPEFTVIRELIAIQFKKRILNYNIRSLILDGLELMKIKNPDIDSAPNLIRRYYLGGQQKEKIETINTSVVLPAESVYWINNYIAEQKNINQFYSKIDFIKDLVEIISKKNG